MDGLQFEDGLHVVEQIKEWLEGQFDSLVSLLAAFAESDNRMAEEIPAEDGR